MKFLAQVFLTMVAASNLVCCAYVLSTSIDLYMWFVALGGSGWGWFVAYKWVKWVWFGNWPKEETGQGRRVGQGS